MTSIFFIIVIIIIIIIIIADVRPVKLCTTLYVRPEACCSARLRQVCSMAIQGGRFEQELATLLNMAWWLSITVFCHP